MIVSYLEIITDKVGFLLVSKLKLELNFIIDFIRIMITYYFRLRSDFMPEVSTLNISKWNLILNAYSKSPEIVLLQKIADAEVSLFD